SQARAVDCSKVRAVEQWAAHFVQLSALTLSPGPMSRRITSWPSELNCESFTQPEVKRRTCRTASPWKKIVLPRGNCRSWADATIVAQSSREISENSGKC